MVLLQRSKAQDETIAELRSQQQSSDDNALHNTPSDFAGFPAAFRSFIFARLMKLCLNLMDRGEATRAQLDRLLKLREEVLTFGVSNEWPDAAAKFRTGLGIIFSGTARETMLSLSDRANAIPPKKRHYTSMAQPSPAATPPAPPAAPVSSGDALLRLLASLGAGVPAAAPAKSKFPKATPQTVLHEGVKCEFCSRKGAEQPSSCNSMLRAFFKEAQQSG